MVADSMGKKEAACKESPGNQGPDGHGQAQEYGVFFDGLKIQQGPNAGNYQQDKKAKRPVYENGKDGSSLALGLSTFFCSSALPGFLLGLGLTYNTKQCVSE